MLISLTSCGRTTTIDIIGTYTPLADALEWRTSNQGTPTLLAVALGLTAPFRYTVGACAEVLRAAGTRASWRCGRCVSWCSGGRGRRGQCRRLRWDCRGLIADVASFTRFLADISCRSISSVGISVCGTNPRSLLVGFRGDQPLASFVNWLLRNNSGFHPKEELVGRYVLTWSGLHGGSKGWAC